MSMPYSPKNWVIIPAAGIGSRMKSDIPKQYLQIENKTILEYTLSTFLNYKNDKVFEKIYVGLSPDDELFKGLILDNVKGIDIFSGGNERSETVMNGLIAIANQAHFDDWVWVHDAARPCLSHSEIDSLLDALKSKNGGFVLGVPVSDTLKRVSSNANDSQYFDVLETVSREGLWRAMTPQVFKYGELLEALKISRKHGKSLTDEASAIEFSGKSVHIIEGSDQNIKVTLPSDLLKVRDYLGKDKRIKNTQVGNKLKSNKIMYPRIGTGFDVHAFGEGQNIIMGGVTIPYEKSLIAHSDGDVLLHAIMDALLGALALGDIGKHFPDTDSEWKGANSRVLLRAVNALIEKQGYKVGNVDSTIIAQAPKMAPHILGMQNNIAEDLGLESRCIGIKATTTETLGFTGRKEGVACQASVLLVPIDPENNL